MPNHDPLDSPDLERLKLFIYLVPIFGFFPSLWSLYRKQGNAQEQATSRLVVTLALAWIILYTTLGAGSHLIEAASTRLLITNTLVTTGYFMTHLWLMIRLWQRKSIKLPGITKLSDRLP